MRTSIVGLVFVAALASGSSALASERTGAPVSNQQRATTAATAGVRSVVSGGISEGREAVIGRGSRVTLGKSFESSGGIGRVGFRSLGVGYETFGSSTRFSWRVGTRGGDRIVTKTGDKNVNGGPTPKAGTSERIVEKYNHKGWGSLPTWRASYQSVAKDKQAGTETRTTAKGAGGFSNQVGVQKSGTATAKVFVNGTLAAQDTKTSNPRRD